MNKAAHKIYLLSLIILFIFLYALSKLGINIFRNYSNHTNNVLSLKKVEVISHRAKCFIGQTENSMDGIKSSINYKIGYAEIDVQETKDGVVVLMHDKTLKRLTGLNKRISQLDYKEIKDLNINRLNFPDYTIEKIPTLEQVAKYSKGKLNLIIDIKAYNTATDLTEKVVDIVKKNNLIDHCIIQSSNYTILTNIKKLDPNIITGYIIVNPRKNLHSSNIDFYSVKKDLVTKKIVERIHKSNKKIYVWTVNTQADMYKLINLGVDC